MITHFVYQNREVLDSIYGTLGTILVVVRNRADAVNLFSEILMMYKGDPSAIYSQGDLTVSTKASKIIVKCYKDVNDKSALENLIVTHIVAIGGYYDEDFEFLSSLIGAHSKT